MALGEGFATDAATVGRMCDLLAHRGPDDAGTWVSDDRRVGLGHRRLSIIDLSDAGRQPMASEDGRIRIVFNGEIYNHEELRRDLQRRGHVYRSRTDTETIAHLYEEVGERCVEMLHGMFALAIWDQRERTLFLARDRLGVKPLYYASLPGGFVFGSEPKAIFEHPAVRVDLDEDALNHYLTFGFAPAPMTLAGGVRKLAPAERMTVAADGTIRSDVYWSPFSESAAASVAAMSESEMTDRVLELLRRSVARRMMSDVPVGVFLSGGVDSSTNVALMAEVASGPIRTFSIAPRGNEEFNELPFARLVADRYGTDHHEVMFDVGDVERWIPELIAHQDEPLSDWVVIPQHFVSERARETRTPVIQIGEGADELFHGYNGYADHRRVVVPFQRWLPAGAQRAAAGLARAATGALGRGTRHAEALSDAAASAIPYWGGGLCFRGDLKDSITANGMPAREPYAHVEAIWRAAGDEAPSADLFQRMTYLEFKQRLSELLLMRLDKIAMLSSVEGREPFLDHELVEFVFALPPGLKHRGGEGKHVLRRAVAPYLPREIVGRRKQGFGAPMADWLRGPFGDRIRAAVLGSTLMERGLLRSDSIDALFERHRRGGGDWSRQLWNLFNVSTWHDRWVAGRDTAGLGP